MPDANILLYKTSKYHDNIVLLLKYGDNMKLGACDDSHP